MTGVAVMCYGIDMKSTLFGIWLKI